MKRSAMCIMCLFLCLVICSCDGGAVNNSDNVTASDQTDMTSTVVPDDSVTATLETQETVKEKIQEIKCGEKIVTEYMEVAINDVVLTYDVLPDDTSGFYTHYPAEVGKVYISVDASVTNKSKQQIRCDKIGVVVANYSDGFIYNGFIAVKDSRTGFTYANITDIDPLETMGFKWLIECPQEVEQSNESLFLEFTINSEKFIYYIR